MREEVWEEPAAGGPDSGWAGDTGGRRLLQQVPLFRLGVQYFTVGKARSDWGDNAFLPCET